MQTLKIGIKKHDVTLGMDDDNLRQVVCLMYQYWPSTLVCTVKFGVFHHDVKHVKLHLTYKGIK